MTKKSASGSTGSLAFDYANALVARRLSDSYRGQSTLPSGKPHNYASSALRSTSGLSANKKSSVR